MSRSKDFLTEKDRKIHEKNFLAGKTNFKFPFEPWVIKSWEKFSIENGLDIRAKKIKENILSRCKSK